MAYRCDVDLERLDEVVSISFSTVKFLSISPPHCPLWKRVTMCSPLLRSGGLGYPPYGQRVYINYMEFFYMGGLSASEDPVNLRAWGSWKLVSPAPCPAPQVAPRNALYCNQLLKKDPPGTRLLRQGGSRGVGLEALWGSNGALLSTLTCSTRSGQQLRADRQADETDGWRLGIQKPEGALTKDNHQSRLTEAMATLGREEGEKAKRQVCAALVPQPLSKACIVQWPGEGQVTSSRRGSPLRKPQCQASPSERQPGAGLQTAPTPGWAAGELS